MNKDLAARFSLEGRTAVVVGAASGIGRQAAITFARAGATLILADVQVEALAATEGLARDEGVTVFTKTVDVRSRQNLEDLGIFAASRGKVEIWANVAGVISAGFVSCMEPNEFDRILDVNLKGTYWGCSVAAKTISTCGRGSIINISSAGADCPAPGLSAYSMSKAGVNMLTRTLAHELGPDGIRVNAVAPGFVDTPIIQYRYLDADGAIDTRKRDALFELRSEQTVLKRIGQPIDVALTMLFLASDASSFMTGQILRPNGGYAMP